MTEPAPPTPVDRTKVMLLRISAVDTRSLDDFEDEVGLALIGAGIKELTTIDTYYLVDGKAVTRNAKVLYGADAGSTVAFPWDDETPAPEPVASEEEE